MTELVPDVTRTRYGRATADGGRTGGTPAEGFFEALNTASKGPRGQAADTAGAGVGGQGGSSSGAAGSGSGSGSGSTSVSMSTDSSTGEPKSLAAQTAFARLTERGLWHQALGLTAALVDGDVRRTSETLLGPAVPAANAAATAGDDALAGTDASVPVTATPTAGVDAAADVADVDAAADGTSDVAPLDRALSSAAIVAAETAAGAAASATAAIAGSSTATGEADADAPTAAPGVSAAGAQGRSTGAATATVPTVPTAPAEAAAGQAFGRVAGSQAAVAQSAQTAPAGTPDTTTEGEAALRGAASGTAAVASAAAGRDTSTVADDATVRTATVPQGVAEAAGGANRAAAAAGSRTDGVVGQGATSPQVGSQIPASGGAADGAPDTVTTTRGQNSADALSGAATRTAAGFDQGAAGRVPAGAQAPVAPGVTPQSAAPSAAAAPAAGAPASAVPATPTVAQPTPAGASAAGVPIPGVVVEDVQVEGQAAGLPADAAETRVAGEARQAVQRPVTESAGRAAVAEAATPAATDAAAVAESPEGMSEVDRAAATGDRSSVDRTGVRSDLGGGRGGESQQGSGREMPRQDMTPVGAERGFTAPASMPVVSQAAAPAGASPAGAPLHAQIMQGLGPLLRREDGTHQIQLQLAPAHLGRVRITLEIRGGEVAVMMQAADGAARELLRDNVDQLRQQLSDLGLRPGSVDVDSGGHADGGDGWQQLVDAQAQARRAAELGDGTGFPSEPDLAAPNTENLASSPAGDAAPAQSDDGDLDVRL